MVRLNNVLYRLIAVSYTHLRGDCADFERGRCDRGGDSPQPGGKAGAWRGGDEAGSDGSRISGTSDGRIKKDK